MISECSKLAQIGYKTRHNWMGKVIHEEFCKKFKFDHTNKWYMYNSESVLENEVHKLLWDFEIQTDHLISARRPDIGIIKKKKKTKNKRTCRTVEFAVPADHRVKHKEIGKSIIKNGQNTEKSPGDLRRLAITQTLVRSHQLTLVWKTLKWVKHYK